MDDNQAGHNVDGKTDPLKKKSIQIKYIFTLHDTFRLDKIRSHFLNSLSLIWHTLPVETESLVDVVQFEDITVTHAVIVPVQSETPHTEPLFGDVDQQLDHSVLETDGVEELETILNLSGEDCT